MRTESLPNCAGQCVQPDAPCETHSHTHTHTRTSCFLPALFHRTTNKPNHVTRTANPSYPALSSTCARPCNQSMRQGQHTEISFARRRRRRLCRLRKRALPRTLLPYRPASKCVAACREHAYQPTFVAAASTAAPGIDCVRSPDVRTKRVLAGNGLGGSRLFSRVHALCPFSATVGPFPFLCSGVQMPAARS